MMCRKSKLTVLAPILAVLVLGSAVAAQSPQTLSYQGRLTDDAGIPLDTTVDLTFRLYLTEAGEKLVWEQTHYGVVVADGLFDVVLTLYGDEMAEAFDGTVRWMSVQIGTGPESDSLVRIGMVPYSWYSILSDTADYARNGVGISQSEADDRYVNVDGDVMTGDLEFDSDSDPGTELVTATFEVGPDATNLWLYNDTNLTTAIWGDDFGEVALYFRGRTEAGVDMRAGTAGGYVRVRDAAGSNVITLSGSSTGDASVIVPSGAINSNEILNEPGLASSINTSLMDLNSSETMVDLQTVTITIPADGYILVTGRCWCGASLPSGGGSIYAYVQIDATEGGGWEYPYSTVFGVTNNETAMSVDMPVYVDRIYYRTAGTYTFRLEGMRSAGSTASASATTIDHQLIATYLPTSYGTVEKIASEPGDHPGAELLAAGERPFGETSGEQYKVDLRYYELKAKAAREAALEAERELEEARDRQRVER